MKKFLFLVLAIIFAQEAFSSPMRETFAIGNYTAGDIIINREFFADTSNALNDTAWVQEIDICGLNLSVSSVFLRESGITVEPGQHLTLVEYYPWTPIDQTELRRSRYAQMDEIPFMKKMRSIFRSLEITVGDGERVITLENLEEQGIRKNVFGGGISYTLEIFD